MDQVFIRTQNMEFANQVLPDLFHGAPDPFLFYLNRDGNKFLNFYWNEAGKRLNMAGFAPAFGMNYDIRSPRHKVTVALVRMPAAVQDGEVHLVGLCYRPSRKAPFFGLSDVSKVLLLEQSGENSARLVEITHRRNRAVLGQGIEPKLEDFYQAVLKEISD